MLNSNEIRLLLSELDLEGSFIQKVTEHDYHSFTLSMFSKREKAFLLYFETGTRNQHFCRTGIMRKKSAKAQRFTQYLRANIVGSRVMAVEQVEGERTFTFTLSRLISPFISGRDVLPDTASVPSISPESTAMRSGIKALAMEYLL